MSTWAAYGEQVQPRMVGKVRATSRPFLRAEPDPSSFVEHRTEDGRRVFVARQVLRDLATEERRAHPNETAGLLFGGHFTDGRQPCTVVTALIPPLSGEVVGSRSSVHITARGAEQMIARAWAQSPLLSPVGWGHTHPQFEAYFSPTDMAEQEAWKDAGSVGLVISGLATPRNRYRVFVGPESTTAEQAARMDPRLGVHASAEVRPASVRPAAARPAPRRRWDANAVTVRWLWLAAVVAVVVAALFALWIAHAALSARSDARAAIDEARRSALRLGAIERAARQEAQRGTSRGLATLPVQGVFEEAERIARRAGDEARHAGNEASMDSGVTTSETRQVEATPQSGVAP